MTASMRVGEDRGLVPAARALLAAAEQEVVPEAERAGDVGEGAHVDHGRAQLGQLALGEVRVLAVQRVGDDSPSTESPRNSRRSLLGSPPFSYAYERCVRARSSSGSSTGSPTTSRR